MALARKVPKKIYEIQAHTQKVTDLDIGATGRVLVTGGQDRLVNLFVINGQQLGLNAQCSMSLNGHNSVVECVKFAYNDDLVYSSDASGVIKKWDLNKFENNSTFYGHMKAVRTIDFHPFGEYVVSGSNDTSVRLWDVRTNVCIKKYRGHIANVNSVKFSPDGSWIASAGTEGCVIIWDIRMSNKLIEFVENASPVTCLQFHPFEFLLAAGRNDGTVDLYDLESKQMISRTKTNSNAIKCITFSEQGNCLFLGSAQGVSVVGWEPDREFDQLESTWNMLGDMKVINNKLICGGFENTKVSIHAMGLDQMIPFAKTYPGDATFNHNHSSRKSFSKDKTKLRLSIGNNNKTIHESNGSTSNTNDGFVIENGGLSSPNLSIEMIDEEPSQIPDVIPPQQPKKPNFPKQQKNSNFEFASYALSKYKDSMDYGNNLTTNDNTQEKYQLSKIISDNEQTTIVHGFPLLADPDSFSYNKIDNGNNVNNGNNGNSVSSIGNVDIGYASDLDYYSGRHHLNNIVVSEKEDFPVNKGQPPEYVAAPKKTKPIATKHKQDQQLNRRSSPPNMPVRSTGLRKTTTSVSTMDLRKIDEQFSSISTTSRKPISRGSSPIRNNASQNKIRKSESSYQMTRDNIKASNRNVTVQFFNKPQRSKTAIDMKAGSIPRHIPSQVVHDTSIETSSEMHAMQLISSCHDSVFSAICNRLASLEMIRNQMRANDLLGALRVSIRIKDNSVFVDLLGAILEKKSAWTLDMAVIVLPQLYELLQSEYKFHCMRACDTLRIIIKEFLPVIQANIDPWSPGRSLGVDISREERLNKCIECRNWLMKIQCLPENERTGSTLTALQNMIVDI